MRAECIALRSMSQGRTRWIAAVFVLLFQAFSVSTLSAQEAPIVTEAWEILAEIELHRAEYAKLRAQSRDAKDADGKIVAELQARSHLVDWMRSLEAIVANVLEQKEQGLDEKNFRQETRKLMLAVDRRIPSFLDEITEENAKLRGELSSASPEAQSDIEARIRGNEETLDESVRFYLSHIKNLDRLDMGSSRAREHAAKALEKRAGNLAARLEIASERLDALSEESGSGPENDAAMHKVQDEFDRIAASLWTTCDVLDELELPSAAHRKALILATGELTTDILDAEVLGELIESAATASSNWVEQRAPIIIGRMTRFLTVLFAFWILSIITRRLTTRLVGSSSSQMSQLAQQILVATASRLVLGIGFLLALSQVGVNVTALLAGLGIAGFVIGFALQETLGNFAAGAMIIIYDPFDVGDVIEAAGVTGKVDQMNLVSTTILTFDNQMLIVPNSRIWGNVIRNATALNDRRVDLSFPLALDANIAEATRIFEAMCREHPDVLADPEPAINVQQVTGAGVLVVVRPWVRTDDYWPTYWALNQEAHTRLSEAGIQIAAARYKFEDPHSDPPPVKAAPK